MDRIRFSALFDMTAWPTLIVGLGGLGLPIALTLAKQGVKYITAFDADYVSEENTGPQLYGDAYVGLSKASAAFSIIMRFSGDTQLNTHSYRFPEYADMLMFNPQHSDWPEPRVVISAVHDIQSRQEIFEWFESSSAEILIDPRMAAESGDIFVVKQDDTDWYKKVLYQFDDNDVPDLACTAKATFHTGLGMAAEVGAIMAALARNDKVPAYLGLDFKYFDKRVLKWHK